MAEYGAIAATELYRSKVAAAVANGGSVPRVVEIAYGRDGSPVAEPEQLVDEWGRFPLASVTANGVVVVATHTLTGELAQENITEEVALIDEDGDLAGRRRVAPKGLDPFSRLDFSITLTF